MSLFTTLFKGLSALPKASKVALGSGVVGAVGGGVATYNILGGIGKGKGEENANNSKNDAVTEVLEKSSTITNTYTDNSAFSYIYANNYGSGKQDIGSVAEAVASPNVTPSTTQAPKVGTEQGSTGSTAAGFLAGLESETLLMGAGIAGLALVAYGWLTK